MGVPFDEIADDPIHMLLYGTNGVGKTTLACQAEKPLALISLEPIGNAGGAKSVKRVQGGTQFRFKECAKVLELGHRLLKENPFRTVVIDSGTSLDAIKLAEVCGWNETAEMLRFKGKVSADEYIERSEQVRKVLRPYLDLPCDVIIICNEKDHNYKADSEGGSRNRLVQDAKMMSGGLQHESVIGPGMAGGAAKWIGDACDYICQLYVDKEYRVIRKATGAKGTANYKEVEIFQETGRWVRRLRTSYHPNFVARVRSEVPEVVPDYIEGTSPADMWERFLLMTKGEPQPK